MDKSTRYRPHLASPIKICLALLCTILISGCSKINDIPIGTGYAAKNICSGYFMGGIDSDILTDRFISPQIEPLPPLLNISINDDDKTVYVEDIIFRKHFSAEAYYREGFGCTLMQNSTKEELDAQLPNPLPYQLTEQLPWPAGKGGVAEPQLGVNYEALNTAIENGFTENKNNTRNTMAIAVIHNNQLIAEQYAPEINADTKMIGWSMTKSFVSTLIGLLQDRGFLDITDPAPVAEWVNTDKEQITTEQLLHMASGLEWFEESQGPNADQGYVLHRTEDFSAFYTAQPLVAEPGTVYNYSTGASSLLGRIAQEQLGGDLADTYYFIQDALFHKINIDDAVLEFDTIGQPASGTYLWLTARDWARLGLLYLNNGNWFGNQVLSQQWIDQALTPSPSNPEYSAQIWVNTNKTVWPSLPENTFAFLGHQQQTVIIVPEHDLVVVRLGYSFEGGADKLETLMAGIIAALP